MSALSDARAGLAATLRDESGLAVFDHVPSKLDAGAGAIILAPSEDYMIAGETLYSDEIEVALDVFVLVDYRGENDTAQNDLDTALVATYQAMPTDWQITATGRPGPQTNGEWTNYGIQLTAKTITHL